MRKQFDNDTTTSIRRLLRKIQGAALRYEGNGRASSRIYHAASQADRRLSLEHINANTKAPEKAATMIRQIEEAFAKVAFFEDTRPTSLGDIPAINAILIEHTTTKRPNQDPMACHVLITIQRALCSPESLADNPQTALREKEADNERLEAAQELRTAAQTIQKILKTATPQATNNDQCNSPDFSGHGSSGRQSPIKQDSFSLLTQSLSSLFSSFGRKNSPQDSPIMAPKPTPQ